MYVHFFIFIIMHTFSAQYDATFYYAATSSCVNSDSRECSQANLHIFMLVQSERQKKIIDLK